MRRDTDAPSCRSVRHGALSDYAYGFDNRWCHKLRWNGLPRLAGLNHVEYLEIRAERGRKCPATRSDCDAAFGQIDRNQNAMINQHWLEKRYCKWQYCARRIDAGQ